MNDRTTRARQQVLEEKQEEMQLSYIESSGKIPEQLCVDKKTYRGKILYWLEPLLPGDVNVVLIEEYLGDRWTLRFEPFVQQIKVFTP